MIKFLRRCIHDSFIPLPNHKPEFAKDQPTVVAKSKLDNGIRLISESQRFPNSVTLGLVLNVGTRDDPLGYLDVYKEMFLKTRSKKDQSAYSVLELAGCDINLILDRETLYLNTACLEEHLPHVLPALRSAIFNTKVVKDTAEAKERLLLKIKPETTEELFKNIVIPTGYSNRTIGIRHPRLEYGDIQHDAFLRFIDDRFTADKLTIAAAGVKDHKVFEDIVHKSFGDIKAGDTVVEASLYTGGHYRQECDEEMTHFSLGFKGVSFFDKHMPAFAVIKGIVGDGGGFSTGGPGKGMHSRAYTKILPYGFIESVKTYNFSFTDSGMFAVSLTGMEKYAEYLPNVIIKELADLFSMKNEELNRAKAIITREAHINYQKTIGRIEDIAKNCAYFYKTPEEFGYLDRINAVTLDDIRGALKIMLSSQFAISVISKKETKLPTVEELYKKLGRN